MLRGSGTVFFVLFLLVSGMCSGESHGRMASVAISPDGKLVAVSYEKGHTSFIYKIAVETGIATRLTEAKTGAETTPAFSPDGKRIAYSYAAANQQHFRIVITSIDGSDSHPWSLSGSDDFSPVFSPDNKTIVFGRSGYYGSYSPIAQPHSHAWNFYASDLDGGNTRQLTNESFYSASPLSVSPDCKSMVVVTQDTDSPEKIAVYSLDHLGKPKLSLRPDIPGGSKGDQIYGFPNYLPDGKSILFMAASNGKRPWSGYDYDVYRLDLEAGMLQRLTDGNGYATDLKVTADGKTAVFLKWRSDWHSTPVKSELYLLNIESHKLTPIKVSGLD